MLFGVEKLNPQAPAELLVFEQAFYQAFIKMTSNRLIRNLWNWDHEQRRLSTKIPYSEQEIYLLKDANGRIASAASCNMGMSRFQSEAFGFKKPFQHEKYFEVLTLFSGSGHPIKSRCELLESARDMFFHRGYRFAFATSSQKTLPMYRRLGMEVLRETLFELEKRYFLRIDLAVSLRTQRNQGYHRASRLKRCS